MKSPYRLVMAINGTLYRTDPKTMTQDEAVDWMSTVSSEPAGHYLYSLERLETTTSWVTA